MATGKLQIQVTSQLRAAPVEDAVIDISSTGEPDQILEEVRTDSVGQTDTLELEAPPEEYSLSPGEMQPYSEYNFRITAPGYEPLTISGAEILANQLALQDIRLKPLAGPEAYDNVVIPAHTLYGDYPPKIAEAEIKPLSQSGEIVLSRVVIPEFIVVHDGAPTDSTAGDYYVRYRDYIKNVASSEIYATWPKAAIRANVLAIMSFTVYTRNGTAIKDLILRSRPRQHLTTNGSTAEIFLRVSRRLWMSFLPIIYPARTSNSRS